MEIAHEHAGGPELDASEDRRACQARSGGDRIGDDDRQVFQEAVRGR
jgi:hypothetical protein